LQALGHTDLTGEVARATLGVVIKVREDAEQLQAQGWPA
jgi:hypothetical protein